MRKGRKNFIRILKAYQIYKILIKNQIQNTQNQPNINFILLH